MGELNDDSEEFSFFRRTFEFPSNRTCPSLGTLPE